MKQEKDLRIVVSYCVEYEGGMVIENDALLNLETGEIEQWIETSMEDIGLKVIRDDGGVDSDIPIREYIELHTHDDCSSYGVIKKDVVSKEGKKILVHPLTDEERSLIDIEFYKELRNPFV